MEIQDRKIIVECPEGYTIDKENSTFECIKFKPIVKRWRGNEMNTLKGYYIDSLSHIKPTVSMKCYHNISENSNIFTTEKQAKSALAMAQISQIMANDERFGGVVTDKEFKDMNKWVYSINRNMNEIAMYQGTSGIDHFLSFHTVEQRSLFLEENKDLVKDYLMID